MQRIVKAGASYSGMIGRKAAEGEAARSVTLLNVGVNSTLRLTDRVLLREGVPELDLLAGDYPLFNTGATAMGCRRLYLGLSSRIRRFVLQRLAPGRSDLPIAG